MKLPLSLRVLVTLPSSRTQNGAALVVGLVLLALLTAIATAGMTTSTLELRMAAGRQSTLSAFQVAENAIETALACRPPQRGREINAADCPEAANSGAESYDFVVRRRDSAAGTLIPEGYSLGVELEAVEFTVDAVAEAARGARAELSQGFYVLELRD